MYHILFIYLIIINIIASLLYGIDKYSAIRQKYRISEKSLHIIELIGGSPAAFIAQRIFHHKTRKTSFQIVFWLIVFLQIVIVLFYFWKYYK